MRAIPPVILTPYGKATPVAAGRPPSGSNPALVYLASLKPSGRVVMAGSLDIVARKLGAKDARSMPWASLRYEHLVALRQWLAEWFKPATANRATWRRSREHCERLGAWVNSRARSSSAFGI